MNRSAGVESLPLKGGETFGDSNYYLPTHTQTYPTGGDEIPNVQQKPRAFIIILVLMSVALSLGYCKWAISTIDTYESLPDWVVVYLPVNVMIGISALVLGHLSDLYGRRRFLIIGLSFIMIFTIPTLFSNVGRPLMVISQVGIFTGYGACFACGLGALVDFTHNERRGVFIGLFYALLYLGNFAFVSAQEIITEHIRNYDSWPLYIYGPSLCSVVITLVLVIFFLKDSPDRSCDTSTLALYSNLPLTPFYVLYRNPRLLIVSFYFALFGCLSEFIELAFYEFIQYNYMRMWRYYLGLLLLTFVSVSAGYLSDLCYTSKQLPSRFTGSHGRLIIAISGAIISFLSLSPFVYILLAQSDASTVVVETLIALFVIGYTISVSPVVGFSVEIGWSNAAGIVGILVLFVEGFNRLLQLLSFLLIRRNYTRAGVSSLAFCSWALGLVVIILMVISLFRQRNDNSSCSVQPNMYSINASTTQRPPGTGTTTGYYALQPAIETQEYRV